MLVPVFFLKNAKNKFHKKTYELQLKLYKAMLIQFWVSLLLCVFPFIFLVIISGLQIQHTSIVVQIILAVMSLHGPVDLFVIG
jgi:hypothetical protein